MLLENIEDELAEELKEKCPVGVFDIEDIGKGNLPFSCVLLASDLSFNCGRQGIIVSKNCHCFGIHVLF